MWSVFGPWGGELAAWGGGGHPPVDCETFLLSSFLRCLIFVVSIMCSSAFGLVLFCQQGDFERNVLFPPDNAAGSITNQQHRPNYRSKWQL